MAARRTDGAAGELLRPAGTHGRDGTVERDADDAARAADDAVTTRREANGGQRVLRAGRGEALTAALRARRGSSTRELMAPNWDGGPARLRVSALAGAMNSRRGGLRARDPSAALPLVLDDASPVSVGDVLVAHPMSCLSQPTLHGAVILLVAAEEAAADDDSFEASGEDPPVLGREGGFVMGLVVNKRSGVTLADAATEHGMAALDNELLASELFVGGDVSSRTLTGVSDVADDSRSGCPSGSRRRHGIGFCRAFLRLLRGLRNSSELSRKRGSGRGHRHGRLSPSTTTDKRWRSALSGGS